MGVHAGTGIAEDGFGHNGRRLSVRSGYVPDDISVIHHIVGHLCQRRVLHLDLALAISTNLVVSKPIPSANKSSLRSSTVSRNAAIPRDDM
jgi:hypothetical protein